jgi:hypothetical protein
MTDSREAHKFDPVGRGLCSVCNLPKNVLQHKRWAEKEYEEALMAEQALLNLDGEWSQEEEDRRIEKAIKKVRIGDTVYWRDPEDGESSGYYAINNIRNDEELGEPIFTLENEMEVTAGDLDFDCEEFTPGTRLPLDDREISISWEQAKAEGDRLLDELQAAALRRVAAKRNLSKYDG